MSSPSFLFRFRARALARLPLGLLLALPAAFAAEPAPAPTAEANKPEVVVLSPFEVAAGSDNGYMASTTLTATRTNEKLENLPNSISVFTPDLLKDLNATSMFDVVEYAVGASNTYSVGQGNLGAQRGELAGNTISFRGIPSIRQLRDGIPWYIDADSFNTERIEFSRGPGGLTYGDVDPGGIINVATKRANFRRRDEVQVRYDSFNSRRATLDLNQPLFGHVLAGRLNAIDSKLNTNIQRKDGSIRAIAGALRWLPFKTDKTTIDFAYETGNRVDHTGHLTLQDQANAYVRGSGTNALDADPVRAGVQTNGVGMQQIATGTTKSFWDIGSTLYNMTATPANVFRFSVTPTTKAVATGNDPQNPGLLMRIPTPFSIIPLGEDWGGPDNRRETHYHSYTLEFRQRFSDHFNLLITNNGQADKMFVVHGFGNTTLFGGGTDTRSLFIDVNPLLPNPAGAGTIPNPHYQDYFVTQFPQKSNVTHQSQTLRSDAVYELKLPANITQRIIGSTSYRIEKSSTDNYSYALSQAEIAKRGFTGAAASYGNNLVSPIHYLKDGNSDAALRIREGSDVTFFRDDPQANNRFEGSLWSTSVSALGSYFSERLHTSVGLSRDYWRQNMARIPTANAQGELQFLDAAGTPVGGGVVPVYPLVREYATNQSYGAVLRLLSWVSASAGYFESSLFNDHPNDYGIALQGEPFGPRIGRGQDYSLRFNALQDRLYATVTYYQTSAKNNFQNVSAATIKELNGLLSPTGPLAIIGNKDSTDQKSHGVEFELVGNPTPNWTIRATFSDNRTHPIVAFPRLTSLLAQAQAAAKAKGLDPIAATAVTQAFMDSVDGTTATFRSKERATTLTTRYTFSQGSLKGLLLGTSARYRMGFPVTAQLQVGGVNVLDPYNTPNDLVVNPFVGYAHKFGRQTWELRLTANNVFDKVTNQGNNPNVPRYTEPRRIIGSATLAF